MAKLTLEELKARVHDEYLDPMWRQAFEVYPRRVQQRMNRDPEFKKEVTTKARDRVYAWLGHKMHIQKFHVHLLTRAGCFEACDLLRCTDYARIREWGMNQDRRRKRLRKQHNEASELQKEGIS
jgi:hypothetical protein